MDVTTHDARPIHTHARAKLRIAPACATTPTAKLHAAYIPESATANLEPSTFWMASVVRHVQARTAASQALAASTVAESSMAIDKPMARSASRVEYQAEACWPSRRRSPR